MATQGVAHKIVSGGLEASIRGRKALVWSLNMPIGYDKLPINHELLLHLTFEEMTGLLAHDRAKPHHIHTLHGTPDWSSLANGLPYLDFNSANPDYLDCPAAATADLNFTTGDFSGAVWIAPDVTIGTQGQLLDRLDVGGGGWGFGTNQDLIQFMTQGAGMLQDSLSSSVLTIGAWSLCGFTRSGASGRLLHNGVDVTDVAATHVDPGPTGADFHLGVYYDMGMALYLWRYNGKLALPRTWGRKLEALEWRQMFEQERHWFGV